MAHHSIFILLLSVIIALVTLPELTNATALSYNVAAHETACFYAWSDAPSKKLGFYFAVQSGGNFDIDFDVKDPRGKVVLDGERKRQGDYVFTAQDAGEYAFCFSNSMSTFADKLVDFEITIESEIRDNIAKSDNSNPTPPVVSTMEDILDRIAKSLTDISRTQKYFRTRENRNSSTVMSTENRIYWCAIFESLAIIGMSGIQVVIVRHFFKAKKGGV
ncbi:emp24/gp25L/p24 family protein [Phycomyces nitens]|nr:emp24/gp25L/p24 family protein [Phycomyces nitens]